MTDVLIYLQHNAYHKLVVLQFRDLTVHPVYKHVYIMKLLNIFSTRSAYIRIGTTLFVFKRKIVDNNSSLPSDYS